MPEHCYLDETGKVPTDKMPPVTPGPHNHSQSEVTNLTTDLAAKAASVHSHSQSDVTNLVSDLGLRALKPVHTVLANDTLAQNYAVNTSTRLTVTANRTLTTTVPAAGERRSTIILTSGTSSFTITFGSGFKPTGTLATGTTTSRVFVINWISDGTNLYEAGRTAAMAA